LPNAAEILSDEDLMKLASEGSRSAFETLVQRWDRAVLGYFQRFTGNAEWSRDLRQELFFRLFRARETYQPGKKFTPWLYRMAHNLAVDLVCRRKSREQQVEREQLEARLEQVDEHARREVWEQEVVRLLSNAMRFLDEDERTILILKHYEHITFEEIAGVLDCPVSTVKTRMYRSFAKLRRYFRRQGVDLSSFV